MSGRQFAGLFWNHASPPVDELSRLEAYCHSILGKPAAKAPAAKPRQDGSGEEEDLTTTVASAMQVGQGATALVTAACGRGGQGRWLCTHSCRVSRVHIFPMWFVAQDPSLIHEFDASKFIVLHMDNAGDAKRQKKQQVRVQTVD